jgi:hypothetical protein
LPPAPKSGKTVVVAGRWVATCLRLADNGLPSLDPIAGTRQDAPKINSPRRRDRERQCAWHFFGPNRLTAFVINDAMVKLASEELPSREVIFIRGTLATVMLSIGCYCSAALCRFSLHQ